MIHVRMRMAGLLLFSVLVGGSPGAFAEINAQGGDIGGPNELTPAYICGKHNWNAGVCNNVAGAGTSVIGMKIINVNANATMGLYDATSVPASGSAGVKEELVAAATHTGALQIFPSPIVFNTAVSIYCGTGATFLNDNTACILYTK